MIEYLILSDFHLGSNVCYYDKIIQALKIPAKNIILAGDIIDIDHLKRLKKKDWKILSLLRKLSKHSQIYYLTGNHDAKIAEILSELLGFNFGSELDITVSNKTYHILHGDKYDSFLSSFPILTEIGSGIYYWLQRLSSKKQVLARGLKRQSKGFIKCCENMKKHGEKEAETRGCDYVVVGHSHQYFKSHDSKYINLGCFTEIECSYLEINEKGNPTLRII